jgi:hypothetical protein
LIERAFIRCWRGTRLGVIDVRAGEPNAVIVEVQKVAA